MLKLFLIIFIKILIINGQNVEPDYYNIFSPCINGTGTFKMYPKIGEDSNSWIGVIDVNKDYPNLTEALIELKLNTEATVNVHSAAGEIVRSDNESSVVKFLRPDSGYTNLKFKVEGQTEGKFPNLLSLTLNNENICKNPQEWDASMELNVTATIENLPIGASEIVNYNSEITDETCGQRKILYQGLITSGDHSKKGDWPWHAALLHVKGVNYNYVCGGSLLNKNTIITAAHCVVENDHFLVPDRVIIRLGLHSLLLGGRHVQDFHAYKITPHEEYDFDYYKNDIALIKLSTEAIYTPYVQPICLWPRDQTDLENVVNETGIVVGWGFTENTNAASDILNEAKMPVVSTAKCLPTNRGFFGAILTETNFCAGFRNGTSVCNGDSGGSMTFLRDNIYRMRGIVSVGPPRINESICNPHEYVVFTDVAKYLDWIENKIGQHN